MVKKSKINEYKGKSDQYPDEFYFDDCLICRAMKDSYESGKEMSTEELREIFKKQNEKNN